MEQQTISLAAMDMAMDEVVMQMLDERVARTQRASAELGAPVSQRGAANLLWQWGQMTDVQHEAFVALRAR